MTEVIIVGAGPAGALAATILARAGVRVRVFERARFPRPKLCGDTLNPGALRTLAAHVPIDAVVARGVALNGMLLTGPGVAVCGHYGRSLTGRSLSRRELDAMLVGDALGAGAELEDSALVTGLTTSGSGSVTGIQIKGRNGAVREHRARLVIAADGRGSRLARAVGVARQPRWPRRWAIGAYFHDVEGLRPLGEMHVRHGYYVGVAPLPDGLANVCLVSPRQRRPDGWRDPLGTLLSAIRVDPALRVRFAKATLAEPPQVLGPMAVDVTAPGVTGLLLAGDAAGFIDPMTGDGLRFAFTGSTLAAGIAIEVLAGRLDATAAVSRLHGMRRREFVAKWRFNRTLRSLVASPSAITASALAARLAPSIFEAIIRYAGDCGTRKRQAGRQVSR